MFLPFTGSLRVVASIGSVLAGLHIATPAQAVTVDSVLTDAKTMASDAGAGLQAWTLRLMAGDMAAIQSGGFVLSGLVAIIGVYLLIRAPSANVLMLEHDMAEGRAETDRKSASAAETSRPMRLLEAITAAKAQMAISEAEKKHAR